MSRTIEEIEAEIQSEREEIRDYDASNVEHRNVVADINVLLEELAQAKKEAGR